MLLISFSVTVMQNMLDICTYNITILDLKFNVKKSLFLRIGSRYKVICAPLILDNQILAVSSECKYLGMYITSAVSFRCTFVQSKMKFYRAFNALYSRVKTDNAECVCIELMRSYCLPIILYGCDVIKPTRCDLLMMNRLVNRVVARIFNTFDNDVIEIGRASCRERV